MSLVWYDTVCEYNKLIAYYIANKVGTIVYGTIRPVGVDKARECMISMVRQGTWIWQGSTHQRTPSPNPLRVATLPRSIFPCAYRLPRETRVHVYFLSSSVRSDS